MIPGLKLIIIALGTGLIAGCGADSPVQGQEEERINVKLASLDEVTPAQWEALGSGRFFFGHQSVGRNMLAGIRAVLEEHPEIRLRIESTERPDQVEGPALIEANLGRNREPATKSDAFRAVLDTGFGDEPGAVAMYKFCYIDMRPETNTDQLFEDYVRRTEAVKAEYPNLTLVHFTMPLVVTPTGAMEWLKTRLGGGTQTILNVKRNRFNDLLREEYGGTDPIFDIAALESLKSDGTRAFTEYQGRKVYRLAPEWSSDGGHLTEAGRKRMAEQFLVFLATLEAQTRATTIADNTGATP